MTSPPDSFSGSSGAEPRCGKYVLHRKIGTGGMAEVFLAEMIGPSGFGKRVALKRLLPNVAADDEFIDSFISEARLGGALEHPNIVQTLELGQEGDTWYLAMELVQGVSLTNLVRLAQKGQLPLSRAHVLELTRQLCAGLSYAHTACDARGRPLHLIHRDLKPANVLINRFGLLKICDFGIARSAASIRNTLNAGVLKGTVSYMSPEQANCLELDHRSDLYSLGAILFELLTLQPLFQGGSSLPGLYDVMRGDIAHRLPLLSGLHPTLAAVVTRLLAFDPAQRYSSADQVSAALEPLMLEDACRPEALGTLVSAAINLGGQGDAERSFSLSERDKAPVSRVIPLGRAALEDNPPVSLVLDPPSRVLPGAPPTGWPPDSGVPRRPAPETLLSLDVRPVQEPPSLTSSGREGPRTIPYPVGPASARPSEPSPSAQQAPGARSVAASPPPMQTSRRLWPGVAAAALVLALLVFGATRMLLDRKELPPKEPAQPSSVSAHVEEKGAQDDLAGAQGNPPASTPALQTATSTGTGEQTAMLATAAASPTAVPPPATSPTLPTPGSAAPASGAPVTSPGAAPEKESSSPPVSAKPARPAGRGYLTVNARPYAYVYVNGRKLPETTPLLDFPLESGTLRLTFKTEDGRQKGPLKVELKPGEHKQLPSVVFE